MRLLQRSTVGIVVAVVGLLALVVFLLVFFGQEEGGSDVSDADSTLQMARRETALAEETFRASGLTPLASETLLESQDQTATTNALLTAAANATAIAQAGGTTHPTNTTTTTTSPTSSERPTDPPTPSDTPAPSETGGGDSGDDPTVTPEGLDATFAAVQRTATALAALILNGGSPTRTELPIGGATGESTRDSSDDDTPTPTAPPPTQTSTSTLATAGDSPTEEVDLIDPDLRALTLTASAFDAAATSDSATATAATEVAIAGAVQPEENTFEVIDEAGDVIGGGVVRLYSPPELRADEAAEIRVEIQVDLPVEDLNPAPSPTPLIGTPRPTPSPLPLQDAQFVEVREFMGAILSGVDIGNFRTDAVPPNGLRRIDPNAINWWKWNIRPEAGTEGVQRLEVRIFIPQRRADGTVLNRETNLLPFEINVVGAAVDEADENAIPWLPILAVAGIAALASTGFYLRRTGILARKNSVFISYRRADSQGSAGRIYDRLVQQFGAGRVFMDVSDIEYGSDFVQAIEQAVGSCDVLLVIMGPSWVSIPDAEGKRRLDNPQDYVRLEVATGLRREDVKVIPALVDGAVMPAAEDLPDDLKALAKLNAINLRGDSFETDVTRLIEAIR
jgi:hypothetical protein